MFKVHISELVSTWCSTSGTFFFPHSIEGGTQRVHIHIILKYIRERKEKRAPRRRELRLICAN